MSTPFSHFLCALLLASFLNITYAHYYGEQVKKFFQDNFKKENVKIPVDGVFLFSFGGLLLSAFIRYLILRFNIPIPYGVFIIGCGMVWGIGVLYNVNIAKYSTVFLICPVDIFIAYVPVVVFTMAFSIDVHTFMKSLPQIFIISIPVSLFASCWTGLLMRLVIDSSWSYGAGVLFGISCTPTYPIYVVRLLKEIGVHTKYTSILLEGESLVGTMCVLIINGILQGYMLGFVVKWYQFIVVLLRYVSFGPLLGYIAGVIGCALMRWMSNDVISLMLLTLAVPYIAFYIAFKFVATASLCCLLIPGIMMGMERTALPAETETSLVNFWKMTAHIFNTLLALISGVHVTIFLLVKMEFQDYVFVIITYLVSVIGRFLSFLIFLPILNRIGYGLTVKNMLICAWSGMRSPVILILLLIYGEMFNDVIGHRSYATIICSNLAGVYILSLLVNGTLTPLLLRVMGLSQISMARQVNMNNCMKYVFERRDRATSILKMDRFLSDANWPMVSIGTNLKHPYKINLADIDQEEDDYFMGYRFTFCPDCRKDILNEPTPKELREMTKEARLRILKAKKICYSRQYENGMVSKEGIRILSQTVEVAMDTEEALINLEGLYKLFKSEGCFDRFTRNQLKDVVTKSDNFIRAPKQYCRRWVYGLVVHNCFEILIDVVIVINMIPIILELCIRPMNEEWDYDNQLIFGTINIVFVSIYLIEFILTIVAYSRVYICADGFRTYFSSWWHILDFIVLVVSVADAIVDIVDLASPAFNRTDPVTLGALHAARLFRFLRLVKLVRLSGFCYPKIIRYFDSRIDRNMAFAYELGKGFVNGEEEVLEMLPYMIDHDKIREDMKGRMESDRLEVTKMLGLTQKERPWIAITVKTRQAIRTILNSMKDTINELKVSGWVDDGEHAMLMKSLAERYKHASGIKSVQPSPPEVIFKEIAWMAGEHKIIEYLYDNVATKRYDPGEAVCQEGHVADGIFIVVTGLLLLSYQPRKRVLENLKDFGLLPVVDYMPPTKFNERLFDYIVSGNSIGELSTLTQRRYSCTITADTHSQVYFLSRDVIRQALELSNDPVAGLECRIWRSISIRVALPILMNVTSYQSTNVDKIKYALERAFVPNLSYFKMFLVTEMIEDVVLIEGVAVDFTSKEIFKGPVYIPRTVKKLILPKSSLLNLPVEFETKLLIIPNKDVNEYDIMLKEEETCEMTVMNSSRCLHHLIQKRASKTRRSTKESLSKSSWRSDKYSAVMQARRSKTSESQLSAEMEFLKEVISDTGSVKSVGDSSKKSKK